MALFRSLPYNAEQSGFTTNAAFILRYLLRRSWRQRALPLLRQEISNLRFFKEIIGADWTSVLGYTLSMPVVAPFSTPPQSVQPEMTPGNKLTETPYYQAEQQFRTRNVPQNQIRTLTGSAVYAQNDYKVQLDTTTLPVQYTLPPLIASNGAPFAFPIIVVWIAGTNPASVVAAGADLINGDNGPYTLPELWSSAVFQAGSGGWFVSGSDAVSDDSYVDASVPAGNTIVNTSAEVAFASQYTIPANTLQVGQVYQLTLWGIYSLINALETFEVRCYIGSTVVLDTNPSVVQGPFTNLGWVFEGQFFVTSIGAAGTIEIQGIARFATLSPGGVANLPNSAPITINTTVNELLKFTWQFTTADPANSTQLRAVSFKAI